MMRNLIIVILLFIGSVSAQTYTPATGNLFIPDSMMLGTSANSTWIEAITAGSIVVKVEGTELIMDGNPHDFSPPASFDTAKFYVDATLGSDANSGSNADTAWQTITHIEQYATSPGFDPGDTIYFRRGEVWGMDSVWQILSSGDATGNVVYDGDSWGAGAKATIRATGTGGVSGIGFSIVRIVDVRYVTFQNFIVDGDNQVGKWGIMVGGNVDTQGQPEQNDEHHITIQDNEIENIGDTDSYNNAITLRCDEDTISDVTILRNHIHDVSSHGITVYATAMQYGGDSNATTQNTYIGYNTLTDFHLALGEAGSGIMITRQSDSTVIEYNSIINSAANFCLVIMPHNESGTSMVTQNVTIRYNYIKNYGGGFAALYFSPDNGITEALFYNIYGNLIWADGVGTTSTRAVYFQMRGTCDYTGSIINFYNNTVISTYYAALEETMNGTFNIRNNILYNIGTISFLRAMYSSVGTLTHSNNLYFSNHSGDFISVDGTGYDATEIPGWEATAEVTDPTFTVEFSNLNLQAGSDAIDGGVAVAGYTTDYDGVAVGSPPNIGAKETTE